MTYRLLAYMMAAFMLLACVDDSFRGASDNLYGHGSQNIPVAVAIGDPDGGLTKGIGAIDKMEQWDGKPIYIYAFNRNVDDAYAFYSHGKRDTCLVDGSVDAPDSPAGKKAIIATDDSYAVWETQDPRMVYPVSTRCVYDFFAYYIDDLEPSKDDYHRADESISIDVEIDGTQDIMSSKAELTPAQLKPFTEKDKVYALENAFSFYTAQRNIIPTFLFKHHLTRLEFELVPEMVSSMKKTVTVHSIAVHSQYKARFTVADRDGARLGLAFTNDTTVMMMRDVDGSEFPDNKYNVVSAPDLVTMGENVKVDGNILVAPMTTYRVDIVMSEKYEDGTVLLDKQKTPLEIPYAKGFEAGKQYKIKLKIQGAKSLSVFVENVPWGKGGNVEADFEDDYYKPEIITQY